MDSMQAPHESVGMGGVKACGTEFQFAQGRNAVGSSAAAGSEGLVTFDLSR